MEDIARYDAIIVGAGIAGLSAARELEDHRVAVVSTSEPAESTASSWATGGIAAAVGDDDSPDLHARDTLEAGDGLCDPEAVEKLVRAAPEAVRELDEAGAGFDRTRGRFDLEREAAHSRSRIVHAGGDRSGRAVVEALTGTVDRGSRAGVELVRGEVVDLCRGGGRIQGVVYRDALGELRGLTAPVVVLATGGVGGLYSKTTNPPGAVGRGLALAYRAGARLTNLEFVQFHPTALEVDQNRRPLLTEALRGAGARLVDREGRSVTEGYDERGDLAPRDVVARAVYQHEQRQKPDAETASDHGYAALPGPAQEDGAAPGGRDAEDVGATAGGEVYLDVEPVEEFADRFPAAAQAARSMVGRDDVKRLPVTPAAHYHMGGVATDLEGATSVDGLWACGEVAHTGVHGANRLASNSMLECLVFGREAGQAAAEALGSMSSTDEEAVQRVLDRRADLVVEGDGDELPSAITDRMWNDVGIERRASGLREAARMLGCIRRELSPGVRARDAALAAELIARSAWRREESRGAHRREDFPREHDGWEGRIEVRRNDASLGDHRVDQPSDAEWRFVK